MVMSCWEDFSPNLADSLI